jgi:hypothetical protein
MLRSVPWQCQTVDQVWSIEEMGALLSEAPSATKRIDKGLILKALGERAEKVG